MTRRPADDLPLGAAAHVIDLLSSADDNLLPMAAIQPDVLVHCAWVTGPSELWQSDLNEQWVEASKRLVRSAIDAGVRRVVGIGTCAEYDWSYELLREGVTPCAPLSAYGKSKLALCKTLSSLCLRSGVSFSWARLFFLYGPHERTGRLISDVVTKLLSSREVPCTDGLQVRDFMNVSDAGEAIVALMESDVTGAVNIASGHPLSVRQLVTAFAAALRHEDLVKFDALPRRADDPAKLAADITRLVREVGFHPSRDLAQGVKETVAWWRDTINATP